MLMYLKVAFDPLSCMCKEVLRFDVNLDDENLMAL